MGIGAVARTIEGLERAPARGSVLAGLLGHGIRLSRSPAMHEAEGAAQGLTYI